MKRVPSTSLKIILISLAIGIGLRSVAFWIGESDGVESGESNGVERGESKGVDTGVSFGVEKEERVEVNPDMTWLMFEEENMLLGCWEKLYREVRIYDESIYGKV